MSTLSQRIAALRKSRGDKVTAYEAVVNKAVGEDRDISDDEQAALDSLKEEIEGIDKQIGRLEESEKIIAAGARAVIPAAAEEAANRGDRRIPAAAADRQRDAQALIRACRMDDYPAAGFTRMAIAFAVAGPFNAAAYARRRWGSEDFAEVIERIAFLGKAATDPMSSDEGTPGSGSLVPTVHMGSEFIEMLRSAVIIGRLPQVRRLTFGGAGALLLPRQTGGVAGGYVGEGNAIRVQRLNFDQLRLTPSKLAVIVPQTAELLRRSDPASEQLVRDDILQGTARTMDSVFLSTAAAGAGPAGILNGIAANAAGALADAATIGTDASQITAGLRAMVTALRNANVPMTAPTWIMNPRLMEYLRLFTTDLGVMPFKAEIDAGRLLGYPIVDSHTVPLDWNAVAGDSIYVLLDCAQLIFAEDLLPTIDASAEAAIQSDDAPATPPAAPLISAFQQDMVFIRLRASHTWNRRHAEAITWAITKV